MSIERTRNFSIIAHIDHGKTTLSDRLLELERERGITIKAHPVAMSYKAKDGLIYHLNLLDTPGHVDFSYEVSRSLAACEGALLLVDASQGVEAQTVANLNLALAQNLHVIPIINKIDLPAADVPKVKKQIEDLLQLPVDEAVCSSAKMGIGIEDILEAVVKYVPAPKDNPDGFLRASVFDSVFDNYRGVVSYVRVFSGKIERGMKVQMMSTGQMTEVKEIGMFRPKMVATDILTAGDVGYVIANVKTTADVKIGDTLTEHRRPAPAPLPGFKEIRPMVFSGIYPVSTDDFEQLKMAMGKLQINDSAFTFIAESSAALGFGFRCGFLGLLHMEIVQERLRREFNMDVISTYPSVVYEVKQTNGTEMKIDNPTFLPPTQTIEEIREPMVKVSIMIPNNNIGDIMSLVMDKRGIVENTETIDDKRVVVHTVMPLNEILVDFNDKLKSITRGYGSMDYEHAGYRADELVRMDIMIASEPVDAFSCIVHRSKAESRGRQLCAKLKEVIPPQLFVVAIQAAIGGKIIARESISAMSKNVTAKCYGGDITRKRKLLEKQKEGKKKMKAFGRVNIPQEAFIEVLKNN